MMIFISRGYLYFSVAVALAFAVLAGVLPSPLRLSAAGNALEPVFRGNPDEAKISFACNVFWGEEFLPSMLESLAKEDVHITFFIGGTWAKANPDTLKELVLNGHEIANHSYSHPHPNALSKEANIDQILRTEQLIESVAGVKTTLYAPPYGEYNDTVLEAVREAGYGRAVMWTADTVDWQRPPPEVIVSRVLRKLQNGAIILMHPTDPTARALPELIREIRSRGYQIVPVSEILY